MRGDTEAVGGFFEDLPVLAFVLAGVLSVAGTASWTSVMLADDERCEALELAASQLLVRVVSEIRGGDVLPTTEAVKRANLSSPMSELPDGVVSLVSVWCVHPVNECLLTVSRCDGEPTIACSESVFINALCDGGMIGILEVRVLVWDA